MVIEKRKAITFRLSAQDRKIIDEIADKTNTPISEFMRKALRNYIFMFYVNPLLNNPQMVFSKNIVSNIFSYLKTEQIEEIAELAYQNSLNSAKAYKNLMDYDLKDEIQNFFAETKEFVYGSTGHNWLDEFDIKFTQNGIILAAAHRLGENFSKFYQYTVDKHVARYGYILTKQRSFTKPSQKEDEVIFYHIVLHYKKSTST